ncbi:hypothetical protein HR12_25270, partial [Microbacterium sp. SUBG005]
MPGFLWSKLGFGAMLVASALCDDDMGDLIDRHRVGLHALVREVLEIAVAEGIELEGFDAFVPYDYLGDEGAADAATDGLVAWLARQTKKRSGIWRDIAVRGRRTEVPTQYAPRPRGRRAQRHADPVHAMAGVPHRAARDARDRDGRGAPPRARSDGDG